MTEGEFQLSEGSPSVGMKIGAEGSPITRKFSQPNHLAALLGCLMFIGLIVGARLLGLFEPLELAAYDAFLQRRPAEPTDPRILLVNIAESDYNEFGQSIPDDALYRLLQKIDSYEPRVVGFDIYRNKPLGKLAALLDNNPRVFGVAKINEQSSDFEIPPPPNMLRDERYGFSDVQPDDNSSRMIRRSYLYTTLNTRNVPSFSAAIALGYLKNQNISLSQTEGDEVSLAKVIGKQQETIVALQRLTPNFGGYQNRSDFSKNYELLVNYRVPMVAHEVTRAEVLAGKVDPAWIQDKVVLIGYQGESFADQFRVPYTDRNVPGFHIHAQVVSHLLSAALDGRKQIWVWSAPLEGLWIMAFGLVAGAVAWWLRSPLLVGLAILGLLVALAGFAFGFFVQAGWVPLLPPGLAVLGCASLVWVLPRTTATKGTTGGTVQIDSVPQQQLAAGTDSRDWIRNERAQTELGTGFFQHGKVGSEPAVGDIGRYKILRPLDSGGMGDVYIANDTRINREVALKVLKARISEDMQDLKLRFLREVRVSAALASAHIVQVSDSGITGEGAPYYVMELLHGSSLRQILQAEKRLSVERAVRIAIQICEGLKLAHEGVDLIENGTHELVRVVHRDLKPENIFLVETGTGELVKLLDFGIAKVLSPEGGDERTDLTRGGFLGTSRYASPEQWSGSCALDQRSDIYSLGMICYEMLSGSHPFGTPVEETETMTRPAFWYEGHVNTPPKPLRTRPDCQHVPEVLDQVLMRCLAKHPAERLTTASQLQQALKDAFPNL
jgi:eukaryotic-like serine/threonine-protein kinase